MDMLETFIDQDILHSTVYLQIEYLIIFTQIEYLIIKLLCRHEVKRTAGVFLRLLLRPQ